MKVTNSMIAKDLRFMGKIYKKLLTYPILSNPQPDNQKSKKNRRNKDSIYCSRPDGSMMRVLVKQPKKRISEKLPGVLWIHGGGYFSGSPEQLNVTMCKTIKEKCVIVSPEYTLSLEAPFPAALEDCYLALKWMKDHAEELGIREDQLFVGGESAGGGLTAALCLYARDKEEVNIAFQMPLYPMIDCRINSTSMKDNDAPVWNESDSLNAWNLYLANQKDRISPYASAALTDDYQGMPPAITFVGTIEPFYCETIAYMENLKKSGIFAKYATFDGCYHGFDTLVPWSKEAKEAKQFFVAEFDYACKTFFAPQNQ